MPSCCSVQSNACACGCDANRDNKLCELTQPHNKFDINKIMPLVDNPGYFCRCCGRLANQAENLCNPIKLNK
jgi:hypothetical protein